MAEVGAFWRSEADAPAPDMEYHFAPAYFVEHGLQTWDAPALTIAPSYVAPDTRGSVLVRSADPLRKPAVRLNMLGSEREMEAMVRAVQFAREIAAAAPVRDVVGMQIGPGAAVQGHEEIVAWLRGNAQHTYHPSCSARIGPEGEGALDPQLRVHGVEGLRVADCSAMPTITRGNTHAPAVMIGERCADFIRGAAPAATAAAEPTLARAS